MSELVEVIAKSLVDNPDKVEVSQTQGKQSIMIASPLRAASRANSASAEKTPARLQLVMKVDDELGERHLIDQAHPFRRQVIHGLVDPAPVLHQLHDLSHKLGGQEDGELDVRIRGYGQKIRQQKIYRIQDPAEGQES